MLIAVSIGMTASSLFMIFTATLCSVGIVSFVIDVIGKIREELLGELLPDQSGNVDFYIDSVTADKKLF